MKVVIALGSNLGDSKTTLEMATSQIREFIDVRSISSFYQTAPVGGPEQPDYLNAVLIGESELPPVEILTRLHEIEAAAGRVRDVHWGARTLDLDLIACGELVSKTPELTLPHPRAHEREFVLGPWYEIDPEGEIVGRGKIVDLLAKLKV